MSFIQITVNGKLSRYLHRQLKSHVLSLEDLQVSESKSLLNQAFLILTFSHTLHIDTLVAYKDETNFYHSILSKLPASTHIIYISSQTLELSSQTYYSKAKQVIEQLISSGDNPYTIIRPGMIFDTDTNQFFLESMNKAAKSLITFYNDTPKTTVCAACDISSLIDSITKQPTRYMNQTLNLGLKRFTFSQIQDFQKRRQRFPAMAFYILCLLGYFMPRLRAYCFGGALAEAPSLAVPSSFDGET